MIIAIASGKGGTGKTTVATSLVACLAGCDQSVAYVDCDVEAPNGHLFLHPSITSETETTRLVPQVDQNMCMHCEACVDSCHFNAIACLPKGTFVYEELCHSCGACALACPAGVITELPRPMGVIRVGNAGKASFVSGTLNVGVSVSTSVVHAAKSAVPKADWTLLDAPPGTSCPMIETVKGCDYVLLVAEPTPFGLHDLRLAIDVAKSMNLKCGVVVNRAQTEMAETRELCLCANVPILAEIPDDIAVAQAYSQGRLVIDAVPGLRQIFEGLALRLSDEIHPAGDTAGKLRSALAAKTDTMRPTLLNNLRSST
ncbi:MAG: ATP-binding protein [Opitutales bacterium]|jgi:MinD superfamily P-loop ATPase